MRPGGAATKLRLSLAEVQILQLGAEPVGAGVGRGWHRAFPGPDAALVDGQAAQLPVGCRLKSIVKHTANRRVVPDAGGIVPTMMS